MPSVGQMISCRANYSCCSKALQHVSYRRFNLLNGFTAEPAGRPHVAPSFYHFSFNEVVSGAPPTTTPVCFDGCRVVVVLNSHGCIRLCLSNMPLHVLYFAHLRLCGCFVYDVITLRHGLMYL